jgi:hypothetical protein
VLADHNVHVEVFYTEKIDISYIQRQKIGFISKVIISPKYELCGGLCVRRSRDVLKKRPLMHPLITEHVSPLKSFLYGYITPLFRSNILNSQTDIFCRDRLLRLDIYDNPFLKLSPNGCHVLADHNVHVEVLYTEKIDIPYILRHNMHQCLVLFHRNTSSAVVDVSVDLEMC